MKILFCEIPYMKNYCGLEENNWDNNIISKFYKEKKGSNPENYIFQDYNGHCYGYIQARKGVVNLSKINFKNDPDLMFKDITVVWTYFNENSKNHIVLGWYLKSNVYKFLQKKVSYPSIGRDLYFNVKSKSKNCFLLPEDKRNFSLNINFKEDTNIFLSENDSLNAKVFDFINNYKNDFINIVFDEDIVNKTLKHHVDNPISLARRGFVYLYEEGNYIEALKFFNTALIYKNRLNQAQILDIEYCKGLCLQFLNAFSFAKNQFEKVINLEKNNIQLSKNLIYLYLMTKDFEKALNLCEKLLKEENNLKENLILKTELNCLKIDILIEMNEVDKVKNCLNNLKSSTTDEFLKIHCEKMLQKINEL